MTGVLLVLRALGLGDALTGVPALRGLRRAYPEHRLVLAAPAPLGEWLSGFGLVDDVLPTPGLQPLQWHDSGHLAVNLHGKGPESHRVLSETGPERMIAFANYRARHRRGPRWRAAEHEVVRWCRLVRWAGGECGPQDLRLPSPARPGQSHDVVLHPGAGAGTRRWPAERWVQLAVSLASRGVPVLLTGNRAERSLCSAIAADAAGHLRRGAPIRSIAGKSALTGLTAVVGSARLLIATDTGVAHLATALGTPSVLLFGPTAPEFWGPLIDTDKHLVIWHPSAPGAPNAGQLDPSLARISVEEVLRAAERLLRRSD